MMVKVHTCKECGQSFLSWKEFDAHVNRHLQKHLDEYTPKILEKNTPWEAYSNIPLDYSVIAVEIVGKIAKEKRLPIKPQLFDGTQPLPFPALMLYTHICFLTCGFRLKASILYFQK
jgi:hypothetical protein